MASPQNDNYHWTQHFNSKKAAAQTAKSNPQLMAFGGAVGAAGAAQRGKKNLSPKNKERVDAAQAATLGAAGGQATYQAAGYGAKKANAVATDKKVYADSKRRRGYTKPEYKKAVEGAKKEYGLKDPKKPNDYKGYLRNFPKEVPGAKVTRTLAHTHMGNRGVALGAAITGAGALAGLKAEKEHDKVKKSHEDSPFLAKNLDQKQIDRRKKVQAASSKTTGTLGLAALGAQAAGLAVSRGKLKRIPTYKNGKVGIETVTKPKETATKIKSATTPLLATSAGIGSLGAFNFASYTKAEANQRKKQK